MDAYGRSGHMPLFEEVKQKMLEQIKNGVWTPDSMLPNELEVAAMFGVSQGTVRRAFRELVGFWFVIRGAGHLWRVSGATWRLFANESIGSNVMRSLPMTVW